MSSFWIRNRRNGSSFWLNQTWAASEGWPPPHRSYRITFDLWEEIPPEDLETDEHDSCLWCERSKRERHVAPPPLLLGGGVQVSYQSFRAPVTPVWSPPPPYASPGLEDAALGVEEQLGPAGGQNKSSWLMDVNGGTTVCLWGRGQKAVLTRRSDCSPLQLQQNKTTIKEHKRSSDFFINVL